ncbi:TniQ family protein [Caballeronia sp. LjRoot29]|uniref:TniQ family protein n=1 Tax=Caballeronia sp. LjRoot29 TaxID=3342315 RepID=UPI003ED168CE
MTDFNYALWDEEDQYSERSFVYSLTLAGRGTPQQEALLGYFHRLALAHQVPARTFFREVVLPASAIQAGKHLTSFYSKYSKTCNGYGKYASTLSSTLMTLTRATGLEDGTLLAWAPLLSPPSGAAKSSPEWCPSCLHHSLETGGPIIWQLAWAIVGATDCSVHLTRLKDSCIRCGLKQRFVSDAIALGRCVHCSAFLGFREGLLDDEKSGARDIFATRSINEMVMLGADASTYAAPEILGYRLGQVASIVSDGTLPGLATAVAFDKGIVSRWARGEAKPGLNYLLEFCFRIHITPVKLLKGEFPAVVKTPRQYKRPMRRPKVAITYPFATQLVREVDRMVRDDQTFVTAKALAAKYGITIGYFKYWLPDQYQRLTEHRRLVQMRLTRTKAIQEASLAREIVRQLAETSHHLPQRKIDAALCLHKLSILDRNVREAALNERDRIRAEWAAEAIGGMAHETKKDRSG